MVRLRGGRHHRIEIARRLAEDEIALGVAFPGVYDGDIGEEAALHDICRAVEFARLLAFGDDGADAGPRKEGGDAGAAGADALGQRALRIEFELKLAGKIKLLEQLVLADIGRDHLLDLARFEQKPEPGAIDAGVVRNDGEALGAGIAQRMDQRRRNAAKAETAAH